MHNWVFGLQFRLIVGIACILGLALGSVSIYVGLAAGREAEAFERRREEVRRARIERLVSRFYARDEGWNQLQPALERAGPLFGRRIIVRNQQGDVVGDSHLGFGNPLRHRQKGARSSPIVVENQEVGSFVVASDNSRGTIREPPIARLVSSLNRYLLWTGLAAGAVGILLVTLVSRRLLAPMQALGSTARRLGGGDLSQRVEASGPREIRDLGHSFNVMAGSLQAAEERRRDLVADVAHELRTPLSNIQGYLEAVKDGLLEASPATIDTIHQQVLHLARMVEDLRLLAQAEAGALRLQLEPDSLEGVLSRSVEAFRARAEAKGVELSARFPSLTPLVIMDRTRIAQVAGNLLENAIQYSPEGGEVRVLVETAEATRARVIVEDEGEGVPAEDIPNVFERLYRVDPSRARSTGGVGLGLTIAKQLIEAHGGTISAENAGGRGFRVIFELPLAEREERHR